MDKNKTVAVVVPIYNAEPILPYCIESIINQTYKNLIIFLIDDGSTDRSGEICDEYKNKDKRIKVMHRTNHGVAITRNIGIEMAKKNRADYICFVDSDDLIDTTYISKLVSMIYESRCKIAWVEFREQNFETISSGIEPPKYPYSEKNIIFDYRTLLKNENKRVQYSFACGKLYEISLFDDIEYINQIYEDGATTFKLIYKAKRIIYNRSAMYIVVGLPTSITRTNVSLNKIDDGLGSIYLQKQFYSCNGEKYLEKCTYAAMANDLISWYCICDSKNQAEVDFDLNKKKADLHNTLISNRKNIMSAPNISLLKKILIRLCCHDMKYAKWYMRYKYIYVYKEAIINKMYKLISRIRR